MNVGILSDIHGDIAALETVLEQLETYHHVDQILCAGDLVGRGPEPDKVVDLMRARAIPTVRGNHDEWSYGLSAESKAYLKELPLEWRTEIAGRTIFMCHGKPGNNLWGLYRDHISNTLLNMMLISLNADVLITGHTHMPLYVRVKRGCVINPGSLYTFHNVRSSSHTYGVLHLPEMTFDLYDITAEHKPLPNS
ncbi:MAG TPA: metallophosphoesterase family protein [Phototrophicaceae bacterium]|nr:metallophosphoesterase family protein [Phototrophicaceae bacterium]